MAVTEPSALTLIDYEINAFKYYRVQASFSETISRLQLHCKATLSLRFGGYG